MENKRQVGASSSSFTMDLFGPKDSAPSSSSTTGLFGSVFGPSSSGPGRDSSRKQDLGSQYSNSKHGTSENNTRKSNGERPSETAEPCYFSSSIYYGGQEVYSPTSQSSFSKHTFKKDGADDDTNGNNSASRGNWWQGSLYY